MIVIHCSCQGSLNDFLPVGQRGTQFSLELKQQVMVLDVLNQLGIVHPEVDLVLCNGVSVGLRQRIKNGDRLAFFPDAEKLETEPVIRLKARPLRLQRFILDVHLGRLARRLRLLGFDVLFGTDFEDGWIVDTSLATGRIVLTRDRALLQTKRLRYGYWVRSVKPEAQLHEVMARFHLFEKVNPFSRCIRCNGLLGSVNKASVQAEVHPETYRTFDAFYRCQGCRHVYWQGTHYKRLRGYVRELMANQEEQSAACGENYSG